MERIFVVARYNENTNWCRDCVIISKGKDIPNEGREASSYAWYILQNYDNLPEKITFCQGRPFDHAPTILTDDISKDFTIHGQTYQSDHNGSPHHYGLEIKQLADKLGIEIPKKLDFIVGAQFTVSREKILKHPKEFYNNLYNLANTFPEAPWCLERLWIYIFND